MASFITAGNATNGLQVSSDNTGILELRTGTGSGTTALTLNTSQNAIFAGNVGIGTTSPAVTLHLKAAVCNVRLEDADTSAYANVGVDNSGSMYLQADPANSQANTAIYFATDGTERARITSGGDFLVGQTSLVSAERLGVTASVSNFASIFTNTAASNPYGIKMRYTGTSPNNSGTWFYYAEDSAASQKFGVASNGGVQNYSANNVNLSDRREKTNFAPAKNYLDVICAIPVQTFNYIDQNMEEDPGETLGVVAQDVQAVAPEMVMESNWGTEEEPKMRLSIYQTDLQYALMKSIQELKAIVDAQAAEIAALKAQP